MSYVVDENGEQNTELNRSSNFSMSRSSLSESKFLTFDEWCLYIFNLILECSPHQPNEDDIRICFNCFESNEKSREDKAISGKSNKQLKNKLYLMPNP